MPNAYTFTAFGTTLERGVLTSPVPNSALTGSTVTFGWTQVRVQPLIGSMSGARSGGNQYYRSGNLGNVLSKTVNGLPTNGTTVYVTLYSLHRRRVDFKSLHLHGIQRRIGRWGDEHSNSGFEVDRQHGYIQLDSGAGTAWWLDLGIHLGETNTLNREA